MYLELSHIIDENTPNYPEAQKDSFEPVKRQEDGAISNTTLIHHFSHNGSHLDAPFHFDRHGKSIEQIPLEDLIYEKPVCINCPKNPLEKITLSDLKNININKLHQADLLMFRTGFAKLRENDPVIYRFQFPGFELDAATFIREELTNLKGIMIDFLSVDPLIDGKKNGFPIHNLLLSREESKYRPILIVEDITLEQVFNKKIRRVFVLPIRFKGLDGAPVSVVAEVEDY